MPISQDKKWYQEAGIKKPSLQIKVLRHIGLEGRLSKRMAEDMTKSDYSDVSNAIESLLERRLIRVSSLTMPGRRDKRYFALTGKGLNAFIDERYSSFTLSSEEFWKAIAWHCILNPSEINFSEIERYCSIFESKYLGHPAMNSYIFQSRFFDNLVNNWLKDNCTFDDVPSTAQKTLEYVAMNRCVTIQDLCERIGETEDSVKKVLDRHAVKAECVNNGHKEGSNATGLSEDNPSGLDQMLLVRTDTDKQASTYELSLFGVVLTVALVRYHHIGMGNARFSVINGDSNRPTLFFKGIQLQEYFDKIASNYQDKLPLVFGKWSLLKRELGPLLLYNNLDFLFYEKAFSVNMGTSIWKGGNKEFCDNLQALAEKSSNMLKVLYIEGISALKSFNRNTLVEAKEQTRLQPLYLKIKQIETMLRYLNNESFSDEWENKTSGLKNNTQSDQGDADLYSGIVPFLEGVFSKEMTFYFYLNLNNLAFTTTRSYRANRDSDLDGDSDISDLMAVGMDTFSKGPPNQRLMRILKYDGEIKRHFSDWMQVLINYQQGTSERMVENIKKINIEPR